jgi:cytochrome oxidase Cu insertion factor (SCO1/SenC/PrrC family)
MPRTFVVLTIAALLFLGGSIIALITLAGARNSQTIGDTNSGIAGPGTSGPGLDPQTQLARTVTAFNPNAPLAPSPLLVGVGLAVPEFELTNQDGQTTTQSVFDGHATVMAFVFTNCQLACPIITGRMTSVYEQAKGLNIRFVSMSVDPERDTPEALREYASKFGIEHDRWTFLTGDAATIERVATEGLKFAISEDPNDANLIQLKDGTTMRNIQHPTKLILIGPDRGVVGIYDPYQQSDLDLLMSRLRAIHRASLAG